MKYILFPRNENYDSGHKGSFEENKTKYINSWIHNELVNP